MSITKKWKTTQNKRGAEEDADIIKPSFTKELKISNELEDIFYFNIPSADFFKIFEPTPLVRKRVSKSKLGRNTKVTPKEYHTCQKVNNFSTHVNITFNTNQQFLKEQTEKMIAFGEDVIFDQKNTTEDFDQK